MTVSFDNSKPIYIQLMDYYIQQICSGTLKPGEKLPSVRETAVLVGVNPNTVQRTYAEMERRGVVEARRGQGSFVTTKEDMIKELREQTAKEYVDQFIQHMWNNGFSDEEIMKMVNQALQKSLG